MISHRVQKRLTHEVHEALALRDKRGQSKHKDKQAARKAAQDNHTAYKTITGLYATTSLTTYARQAKTALCWIAERYGCRNLAECKQSGLAVVAYAGRSSCGIPPVVERA